VMSTKEFLIETLRGISSAKREASFQAQVKKKLEARGVWVHKNHEGGLAGGKSYGTAGTPDLICLRGPSGAHFWIELKVRNQRSSAIQEKVSRDLTARGAEVFVVRLHPEDGLSVTQV